MKEKKRYAINHFIVLIQIKKQISGLSLLYLLVASARLYTLLCQSVCPLVRRSVISSKYCLFGRFWAAAPKWPMTFAFTNIGKHLLLLHLDLHPLKIHIPSLRLKS